MRTNCFLQLLEPKEYFSLESMNTPPKINISMISEKKGKLNICFMSTSGQLAYHLPDNRCTSAYLICHTINMAELQRLRHGQKDEQCEAAKSDERKTEKSVGKN